MAAEEATATLASFFVPTRWVPRGQLRPGSFPRTIPGRLLIEATLKALIMNVTLSAYLAVVLLTASVLWGAHSAGFPERVSDIVDEASSFQAPSHLAALPSELFEMILVHLDIQSRFDVFVSARQHAARFSKRQRRELLAWLLFQVAQEAQDPVVLCRLAAHCSSDLFEPMAHDLLGRLHEITVLASFPRPLDAASSSITGNDEPPNEHSIIAALQDHASQEDFGDLILCLHWAIMFGHVRTLLDLHLFYQYFEQMNVPHFTFRKWEPALAFASRVGNEEVFAMLAKLGYSSSILVKATAVQNKWELAVSLLRCHPLDSLDCQILVRVLERARDQPDERTLRSVEQLILELIMDAYPEPYQLQQEVYGALKDMGYVKYFNTARRGHFDPKRGRVVGRRAPNSHGYAYRDPTLGFFQRTLEDLHESLYHLGGQMQDWMCEDNLLRLGAVVIAVETAMAEAIERAVTTSFRRQARHSSLAMRRFAERLWSWGPARSAAPSAAEAEE